MESKELEPLVLDLADIIVAVDFYLKNQFMEVPNGSMTHDDVKSILAGKMLGDHKSANAKDYYQMVKLIANAVCDVSDVACPFIRQLP